MSRTTRGLLATLVAGAVFGLAACGTTTSSGAVGATASPVTAGSASPAASASASPATSESPAASAITVNQAIVQFETVGGSNITGGAILTDLGEGETAVTIGVVAAGITEPMPAHVHTGTCASPGTEVAFPLTDLTAGASNTVLKIALDDLTSTPYAIDIHASAEDDKVVACANVTG
jgi:hypothetical protein